MAEWKRGKKQNFGNVVIEPEWEYKQAPWMIIFKIMFKLEPTDRAQENFKDENDFHHWLANQKIGKKVLRRNFEDTIKYGYQWEDAYEAYEHTLTKFRFGRKSDYQVDIYAYETFGYSKDEKAGWKNMKYQLEKNTCKKIAAMPCFKSDEYVTITAK